MSKLCNKCAFYNWLNPNYCSSSIFLSPTITPFILIPNLGNNPTTHLHRYPLGLPKTTEDPSAFGTYSNMTFGLYYLHKVRNCTISNILPQFRTFLRLIPSLHLPSSKAVFGKAFVKISAACSRLGT